MSLQAHHRFILDTMQRNQDIARNIINELEAENACLKAEVERLYRNGDLMLKFASANMPFPAYATMAKDWQATKEGKPSV
jgi:hypothetical protein